MTSPASAQFPWSIVPEPPSGEFRGGRLPEPAGGGYIAARGSRPGPALLMLVGSGSGFPAVHGIFRLAEVLDAHRLAGSLLIHLVGDEAADLSDDLLDPAGGLIELRSLLPGWRQLATSSAVVTGRPELDDRTSYIATLGGAPFHYALAYRDDSRNPLDAMAQQGRPAVSWTIPDDLDERDGATERVFQGAINLLRGFGMLEGQIVPQESRELGPPVRAFAPVAGYWTPVARPGQRIRINDSLGSFRDVRGDELGDFLTNISGILVGVSTAVWVESGEPVAELARPLA